jgi:hypothetical protein
MPVGASGGTPGMGWESHGSLRRVNKAAVGQRRVSARRWRRIVHHPLAKVGAQRVDRMPVRNRIRRKDPATEVRAGTVRRLQRGHGETASAPAVLGARDVVPTDVTREWNVPLGRRAHQAWTEHQTPGLRGAKVLHNLWAGPGHRAPIENTRRQQASDRIRPSCPPLRTLAPGLVQLQRTVGLREPGIERHPPARDDRPDAVIHPPVPFILIETELQKRSQEVSRLRPAPADHPRDLVGQGIGRPFHVLDRVPEERRHVTEGGVADTKHRGILRREHHLIEQPGIEAGSQTDLCRIRRTRKRIRRAATGPGPVTARDRALIPDRPLDRL